MYLTINTSSDLLTVTLSDENGQMIVHRTADAHLNHASLLMPTIKEVIADNETRLKGIICAQGPGSFTGIRIGLTTANALAYGYDIPVVAVNVLDAWLLYGLHFFSTPYKQFMKMHEHDLNEILSVVTLIDAGRNEAYLKKVERAPGSDPFVLASWRQTGDLQIVSLPIEGAAKPLTSPPLHALLASRSIVIGSLRSSHADALGPELAEHLSLLYFDQLVDLGPEITEIGLKLFLNMTTFQNSGQIAPLYIREAQITKSKKETLA